MTHIAFGLRQIGFLLRDTERFARLTKCQSDDSPIATGPFWNPFNDFGHGRVQALALKLNSYRADFVKQ